MRREENPPNRFAADELEWEGEPPFAELWVYEERCRDPLSRNESPDVGFDFSLNPYRGCFHGCAYCYARPTHPYLGFGAGTDFERRITVKVDIVERLRERLSKRAWKGDVIALSGNTDCYQPLEARYELTRGCLEVLAAHRNPVTIITKGTLVARDIDVLQDLARWNACRVTLSIPFSSAEDARRIEPYVSPPSKRFETLRRLSDAGIPTAVAVAPVIPGINDAQIPKILERARDAGARSAFWVLLRLPGESRDVFRARLKESHPDRAKKVESALRQMRQGRLDDPRFGARMRGEGPRHRVIEELFERARERLGLSDPEEFPPSPSPFRRPSAQLGLFS